MSDSIHLDVKNKMNKIIKFLKQNNFKIINISLPLTKKCPKPLLPIAGKPVLEHIIVKANSEGFDNFILTINYLGHMIKDFFGNGSKWGVKIKYLEETN